MCPAERCSDPFGQLTAFLDSVLANAKVDDVEPKVVLSTIHSAKGLEWGHVWIVGCVEGKLPHSFNAMSAGAELKPEDLEEERRLMYVAMTRARTRLILTRYEQEQDESGREVFVKPSRFLVESLGADEKAESRLAQKPDTQIFQPGQSARL
jgi:ATP-dependent DNA helicase Rep